MQLGMFVRRLEQTLTAAKADAFRESGLTVPQHLALLVLAASPNNFSAAQLARVCLVTPQTMSTITANLLAKGLIEKHRTDVHAQVLVLKATPAGLELLERVEPGNLAVEARLISGFTPEEQEKFREFLIRALSALTDPPGAAG
ncbi:MarR family winged helix-turn-helix transcriptional regulator [Longispora urticae]